MKKFRKIFIITLVVLVALVIMKDVLISSAITAIGSNIVGAPIKIGSFSLGIFSPKIRIKNMKLYNPPGFPLEPLIDLPEISVQYDLGALLKGALHLPLVIVHVKEMAVIKNKAGKLNVDSLKVVEEQKALQNKGEKRISPSKEKTQAMSMHIDLLRLNVERVLFKDYTKGEPPKIEVYDVGLNNKEFKNINSPEQLVVLILVQGMGPTAIKGAAIYGVATFLGASFLPVGVIGLLVGKDDASFEFNQRYDKVYDAALDVAKQAGQIKSENRSTGIIKGSVPGADVTIKITDRNPGVLVTISARQFLIPKPELAGGVLYQISEKLR